MTVVPVSFVHYAGRNVPSAVETGQSQHDNDPDYIRLWRGYILRGSHNVTPIIPERRDVLDKMLEKNRIATKDYRNKDGYFLRALNIIGIIGEKLLTFYHIVCQDRAEVAVVLVQKGVLFHYSREAAGISTQQIRAHIADESPWPLRAR